MITPEDGFSGEVIEPSISRLPQVVQSAIMDDNIVVNNEPRISANKLAEYMVADHARQRTIIRDSKYAKVVVVVPYQKARTCISESFMADGMNEAALRLRSEELKAAPSKSTWQDGDNERSADALSNLADLTPELNWDDATQLFKPGRSWGQIKMAGVRVSIQPEIVFSFNHRNITKVGGIIVNTAIGEEKSLEKSNGGHSVGDYLSSLLFQMLIQRLKEVGPPLASKCFAIDIFRKKIYQAPPAFRALNKQMEAACEVIALRWPTIERPVNRQRQANRNTQISASNQ